MQVRPVPQVRQVRPAGPDAALLTVEPGTAAAWRALLLDLVSCGELPPPVDVVPGHRTLLVDGLPAARLAAVLKDRSLPAGPGPGEGAVVEVPTVYDGEDLAAVATEWGTDIDGVIRRHTGMEFAVEFCGFAPGFAYLASVGGPDAGPDGGPGGGPGGGQGTGLADVPRRSTPRTRVPAGSVGLAGRYCGIYPTASPGGWQLIGRTGLRLFDIGAHPPALLPPGTRVRFVAVDDQPPAPRSATATETTPAQAPAPAETAGQARADVALTVVRCGALTTVQDAGRPGSAHLGVPRSGALDRPAARLANRLVGNPEGAAVLETTVDGVALRFARATAVAVTGAPAPVRVDGRAAEWGVAVAVPAGGTLDVGAAIAGVRSYVAVGGGLEVEPVLGSRSTDTLSGLGPAPLADGGLLTVGCPQRPPGAVPFTVPFSVPSPTGDLVVRLHLGPDDDWFTADGLRVLTGSAYAVSAAGNRVGARLDGPPVAWSRDAEMDSAGMVLGSVQVPPDGQPLVFLADHPTTGGYPVAGVVHRDDLAALAQARPGTGVRFRADRQPRGD